MVKEEPYLTASTHETLKAVNGSDMPNTSNNLEIPPIQTSTEIVPDDRPPAMAFAKRRSQNEDIVINDINGLPTIEIYNNVSPWELMIIDFGSNWELIDESPENCQVKLNYYDPIAKEVADEGFFKKLFKIKSRYQDQSGQYQLDCSVEPSRNLITLSDINGQAPASQVVDDLFAHIFDKATQKP